MEMKTARGKIIKELVRDFECTVAQGKDAEAKPIYEEILAKVAEMENEILKADKTEEKLRDIRYLQRQLDTLEEIKGVFEDIHLEECLNHDDFQNLLPTLLGVIKANELPIDVICNGIKYTQYGEYSPYKGTYFGSIVVWLSNDHIFHYFTDHRYDIDDDIEKLKTELEVAIEELDYNWEYEYPYDKWDI